MKRIKNESLAIPKGSALVRFIEEKKKTIVEVISALFVLLFAYTAITKLPFIDYFIVVLGKSPLIGSKAAFLGWAIIITELIVAALLIIPRTRLIGLYGAFALMLMFTFYIAYMLAFTPNLPCSCGGVIGAMNWSQHLVFNIFFTLLGLAGIRLMRSGMH